ncbi:MAG: PD-(D/E)XK nuclease family protein, partial [Trueperaceae bacterium]
EAVARGGAFEPTLAWLAHPAVGALDADAVARVRTWRPANPRAWARAVAPAVAGEREPDARARADALVAALAWPERARASAWRARLGDAPAAAGLGAGPGDAVAADAAPVDPAVAVAWAAALDALGDGLGEIDEPGADADPALARGAVLGALRDALRHTLVRWTHPGAAPSSPAADDEAPQGSDDDAVWLRPLQALADRRPAHVLLLGAVDGVLPTAVADDPVLGFRERAALAAHGWPFTSAGDAGRLEALRFWGALRAARSRVWIGVPAQTGGDARLPSPFLARMGVEPGVPAASAPASPGAFRAAALRAEGAVPDGVDAVLAGARRAWRQALERETGRAWGPEDGFVGVGVDPDARVWSATQLRDLGSCRFRWWVGRLWGVRAPDEGVEALTPLLEGRLYHLALEGALRAAVGRRGLEARAAALDALDAAFAAAEAAERLDDVVPHWARLRSEHLAHLRALIGAPDFLPDDHEVVGTEDRFEGVWHGWRVQGYVDRIDRTPDGIELIDYKLSGRPPAGARDAELKPTLDLQLPLYVDVAAPVLRPGEPVAGAAYVSLRTRARLPARAPGADDLADLLARLRASLAAGFFPPEPDPSVCRLCDLESVCRKGPHLERRPAPYRVPEAEEASP